VVVCEVVAFHFGWWRVLFLLYSTLDFVLPWEVLQDEKDTINTTHKMTVIIYKKDFFLPIVPNFKAANIQYSWQTKLCFNDF